MLNVCPNCHYLGHTKHNYKRNDLITGIIFVVVGIIGLILDLDFLGSQTLFNILAVVLILIGANQLIGYYRGSICPKCKQKSLLAVDNPEAIKLIKEYDLRIGEDSSENNKQESTSSS